MTPTDLHRLAALRPLLLASGSPRRLELLKNLGLSFTQTAPHVDETQLENEPPVEYALRVAGQKALTVAQMTETKPFPIVLGCDTIVILDGVVFGKPRDDDDATRMLTSLIGRRHTVSTAVAFAYRNRVLESAIASTDVYFNMVSEEQIRSYIKTKESCDKAGAYGIQGMGSFLVDRIEGKLDTVIGLPCALLEELAGKIIKFSRDILLNGK